ncbi:hypothetical protein [Sphingomonas sp. AX6]|nr:hypothetical protein [Sphingomonas sp. AX6]
MTVRRLADWGRANRWTLALIFVVFMGYQIGKDRALRDNRVDAVAAGVR